MWSSAVVAHPFKLFLRMSNVDDCLGQTQNTLAWEHPSRGGRRCDVARKENMYKGSNHHWSMLN